MSELDEDRGEDNFGSDFMVGQNYQEHKPGVFYLAFISHRTSSISYHLPFPERLIKWDSMVVFAQNPAVFVHLSFYELVFVRGCRGAHRRARLLFLSAFVCGDYCLPASCYYTMKHDFPISSLVTSLLGSHPALPTA
ncbi:hypothetical protein GOODEAATRI_009941 [Goodea atripinnis]|uniref:Uncharacterized protein n=1 Tax=Goodea atripinnis TaxID=208336 RepID=A0ABV0MQT5_9TELE